MESRSSAESVTVRGVRALGAGLEGEEDEPLIRRRRHQSILGRSRILSHDRGRHHSLFGDVGGEMAKDVVGGDDGSIGGGTGATQEKLAIEKATANFLAYTRLLLKHLNATSFSSEGFIALNRRKDIAAAVFYHILAPSTMDVVRPKQDVSYQDIQVELIG